MPLLTDTEILRSYHDNAEAWTDIVRQERIASRVAVTNRAICDAVLDYAPKTALDVGCGEGWLTRALREHGVETYGVDAIPALIERANESVAPQRNVFSVASYADIATGAYQPRTRFDAVVCNFALIGEHDVDGLLRTVPTLLTENGVLVIQTLHSVQACGDAPYKDGWREGSWAGFGDDFTTPAPWYFRTIGGWLQLLISCGFQVKELREPLHPETLKPASLILIAGANNSVNN
jgi:2-polyprenyl-3-methyl-5-hydroxy-6-metoxy-1,4-benzoquinol methylase